MKAKSNDRLIDTLLSYKPDDLTRGLPYEENERGAVS